MEFAHLSDGFPTWFRDPTEYEGPFLGRHRMARFQTATHSFVYERYEPKVVRADGWKTFLVIGLGGIPGFIKSTGDKASDLSVDAGDFVHERFQAIIRAPSLHEWWISSPDPEEARWLYTDSEGQFKEWSMFRLRDRSPFEIEPLDMGI